MLTLYRENGVLFAQCLLNLKRDIQYKNQVFKADKKNVKELIEVDAVYEILRVNGNIKIFNGQKYVKLNLGQFSHLILNNKYLVEEIVEVKEEPKKVVEEVKPIVEPKEVMEVPKQQPKEEPKKVVEEVKPIVEPKEEVVEEEPKENDNKKKRHKNNQN